MFVHVRGIDIYKEGRISLCGNFFLGSLRFELKSECDSDVLFVFLLLAVVRHHPL